MIGERIVVTGIGVVSPNGTGRESFWSGCLEGRSGAHPLESPWIVDKGLATRFACTVREFDPVACGVPARQVALMDRVSWFALACAREALEDAGFRLVADPDGRDGERVEGLDPFRLATVIGSGIGGLRTWEASHAAWMVARNKNGVKRYTLPMLIPNAPAGQVACHFSVWGECKALATACATGTMAVGDAWRLLREGVADVVLAGGAEACASDEDGFALLGFERLRTLSRRNEEPERASRPFDRDRDGFVLGEGAAVLVLEREGHARARGAVPYAAVEGYASNCDAVSMLQMDDSGEGVAELIRAAASSAGLDPREIVHVNAHGTSTVLNDRTEARALRTVLGSRSDDVRVTALKSMTGHAIAGSGSMEIAALALSLRRGVLTPTINYETPDPDCDVHVVANRPVEAPPGPSIKLSYGFGGHNACVVLVPA